VRVLGLTTMVLIVASSVATPVFAQGTCQRLWVERNAIYKAAGYCFNTQRGIRFFGNAGCSYDNAGDVPLSARARARISNIVAEERARGCN